MAAIYIHVYVLFPCCYIVDEQNGATFMHLPISQSLMSVSRPELLIQMSGE